MARDSFDDVAFPCRIALGARGGPRRRTDVVTLASGREVRRSRWAGSRRQWQVALPSLSEADAMALSAFFEARGGRQRSFAFRDPFDHRTGTSPDGVLPTDETLGDGDGTRTVFALNKSYGFSSRPIHLGEPGSLRVALNGQETMDGWSLAPARDAVVFDVPPSAGETVTAGFAFDVPARFGSDELVLQLGAKGSSVPSLTIMEVLW
jgi:uncharacterized protein (TIGR02217 family)